MPRSWPGTVVPIAIGLVVVASVAGATLLAPDGPAAARRAAVARLEWRLAGTSYDAARYPDADFATDAAALPAALTAAVRSELHLSPAAYLAHAQAAADAAVALDGIRRAGVTVRGARMDGAELTVYVADAVERTAVDSIGAHAVVGAPSQPVLGGTPALAAAIAPTAATAEPAAGVPIGPSTGQPLDGGNGYYYEGTDPDGEGAAWVCSVGFTGRLVAGGAHAFVTAGHCGDPAGGIAKPDGPVYGLVDAKVGDLDLDDAIGAFAKGSFSFGSGHDAGLVKITAPAAVTRPEVTVWSGGRSGGAGVPVIGASAGVVGAPVCRSGLDSGWQCGVIEALDRRVEYDATVFGAPQKSATRVINTLVTSACAIPGDSGGPILMGQYAVGITSLSDWDSCGKASVTRNNRLLAAGYTDDSDATSPHFVAYTFGYPMVSPGRKGSVSQQLGSRWRLDVSVPAPQVSVVRQGRIAGTVAGTSSGTTVVASVDGVALPAVHLGSGGAFAIAVPKLSPGGHVWQLVARRSGSARSDAASGTLLITGDAGHDSLNQAPAAASLRKVTGPKPSISGAAREGRKLVARTAGWTPGTAFGYQWYAGGKPIAGATAPTLTLTAKLVAKRVTVRVVGGRTGYAARVATSKPTSKVARTR